MRGRTVDWIYLLVAGVLEVGWAIGLGFTDGFSKLWPTVFTVLGMVASVFFLSLAVRTIPLSTAYVIWTGIGAVGTVLVAMALRWEPVAVGRLVFIGVVVAGVAGLKLTSGH